MTTREDLLAYVKAMQEYRGVADKPIFSLYLFMNPNSELIYDVNGEKKPSGFPDTGSSYEPGFYYDLDNAIQAMHENICDIRETCYKAGFILCRFPGLYDTCGTHGRMYFVWDDDKQGFFEQEEPEIFRYIAY